MGSGTGYIEKFPVVIIASRAENEVISSAADVFCEFCAGNGNFFRAELCNGAFWADMVTDSRAGVYISLFRAGLAPFSRAELCNGVFRADMVADSRAGGMALAMQEPQELHELQMPDNGADQLIWE